MKFAKCAVCLLFLAALAIRLAYAQLPTFQHAVLIVQENRTPDNLFGGNPTFETGVDITQPRGRLTTLAACYDPRHRHSDWKAQYNNGNYTPCASAVTTTGCSPPPTAQCFQDTYVDPQDVDPYFSDSQQLWLRKRHVPDQ